jgi:hypothetical protein
MDDMPELSAELNALYDDTRYDLWNNIEDKRRAQAIETKRCRIEHLYGPLRYCVDRHLHWLSVNCKYQPRFWEQMEDLLESVRVLRNENYHICAHPTEDEFRCSLHNADSACENEAFQQYRSVVTPCCNKRWIGEPHKHRYILFTTKDDHLRYNLPRDDFIKPWLNQ